MFTSLKKPICYFKWCRYKKTEGNSLLKWQKKENIDNNSFSSCSLEILNLHRKSKYEQIKNIARFLDQQLSPLCFPFVHILIIYANLKFSIGSYWNCCQFFYLFVTSKASFLQSFCICVIWSNKLISSIK